MPPALKPRLSYRYILLVGIFGVALYIIVPQLGDLRTSWHVLRHIKPVWAVLAVCLTAVTYFAAAATYCLLAFRPLRYGQVVLVQLAAMFINRLLPGGIGAVGANYAYLRRSGHSQAQAASVVAINNMLGLVGHGLLVVGTLAIFSQSAAILPRSSLSLSFFIKSVGAVATALIILVLIFGRQRLAKITIDLRNQLFSYRKRPGRLPAALLTSMLLTLSNVLCLWACASALSIHLSWVGTLLVFSFGVAGGAAIPTPGGLGGFEAGLVAGFVAYNVPISAAFALALLYRLISYWLPLAVGALSFIVCQRRQLFTA